MELRPRRHASTRLAGPRAMSVRMPRPAARTRGYREKTVSTMKSTIHCFVGERGRVISEQRPLSDATSKAIGSTHANASPIDHTEAATSKFPHRPPPPRAHALSSQDQ
eukprot:2344535-Prymnesium_polylepis.1